MSVADQITRIKNNIEATYTAAQAKGATMPTTLNSENLPGCVGSIPTSGGTQFGLTAEQMLGTLDSSGTLTYPTLPQPDFSGIVAIPNNAFRYKFNNRVFAENTAITFPDLTSISPYGMSYAFPFCTGITSLSFPALGSIGSNALPNTFENCASITSISFPVLTTIGNYGMNYTFYGCSGITSVAFPQLTSIGTNGMYYAFQSCTSITSVSFPQLASIGTNGMANTFQSCSGLTSISFPALTQATSAFNNYTFNGCDALTEIHFRADMQTTIEAMPNYSTKFGAPNATIYFDL